MKRIHVTDDRGIEVVKNVITGLLSKSKKGLDIVIKNHSESLREAQRGLYWVWIGVMAPDMGYDKEELHDVFKRDIFLNIYIADPDNHPIFIGVVENMEAVKKLSQNQYHDIRLMVLNGVSHLHATKNNMTEVLRRVEQIAQDYDIRLPAPPRQGLL